jgi:hypothetical protein
VARKDGEVLEIKVLEINAKKNPQLLFSQKPIPAGRVALVVEHSSEFKSQYQQKKSPPQLIYYSVMYTLRLCQDPQQ